ncbi:MAG: CapA family protein [Balneolales bacterium]
MNILIGGDLVVTDEYQGKNLFDPSVLNLFKESDFRIINLEAPITNNIAENKIVKTGIHLRSSESTSAPFLKALNINLVTLANNHILDYGEKGINDTLNFCKKYGLESIGSGNNLKDAQKSFRKEIKGIKISIINFAENEWASATSESAGSNPMELIDNVRQIELEKEVSDFVLVIIHGGNKSFSYPSPRMVKQYRFYADRGADIIVGHHPHCINGYEIYNKVPIFYSLGNFLFTKFSNQNSWYKGLVLKLKIDAVYGITFKLYPVEQDKQTFKLKVLNGQDEINMLQFLNHTNNVIQDSVKLMSLWAQFTKEKKNAYLMSISPFSGIRNRYLKSFIYRSGLYKSFFQSRSKMQKLNMIRCEAHREALIEILNNKTD